jgi:predicted transcriptional regulator
MLCGQGPRRGLFAAIRKRHRSVKQAVKNSPPKQKTNAAAGWTGAAFAATGRTVY